MNNVKLLGYAFMLFCGFYLVWRLFIPTPNLIYQILVAETLLVGAWFCALWLYEALSVTRVAPYKKCVLITGCDSGFGNALAKRLDDYGFHVFATVLNLESDGALQLRQNASSRMRILQMDVTSPEQVESVVHEIRKCQIPLWAVVNNAGIGTGCPFDWGHDVDEYRRILEVNVLGLVRVTKQCISLLRHSRGRVVNVSSLAARLTVPQMAHYGMAKYAVRAFTDAIRREPQNARIKVISIEPAMYKTPIIDLELIKSNRTRMYAQTPDDIKAFYGQTFFESLKHTNELVERRSRKNLNEVIDAMEKAITLVTPSWTYWCCGWADSVGLQLLTHLPEPIVDLFINYEQKKFRTF